jgi:aminopeptidase N
MVSGPIKTVQFEESPLMSTYLVAMVVGVFDFVEGVTSQGITSFFPSSFTKFIQPSSTFFSHPLHYFI